MDHKFKNTASVFWSVSFLNQVERRTSGPRSVRFLTCTLGHCSWEENEAQQQTRWQRQRHFICKPQISVSVGIKRNVVKASNGKMRMEFNGDPIVYM